LLRCQNLSCYLPGYADFGQRNHVRLCIEFLQILENQKQWATKVCLLKTDESCLPRFLLAISSGQRFSAPGLRWIDSAVNMKNVLFKAGSIGQKWTLFDPCEVPMNDDNPPQFGPVGLVAEHRYSPLAWGLKSFSVKYLGTHERCCR
jgi:hypothetical protein